MIFFASLFRKHTSNKSWQSLNKFNRSLPIVRKPAQKCRIRICQFLFKWTLHFAIFSLCKHFCPHGAEMEALQLQNNMPRCIIAGQNTISLMLISTVAMHSKRKIKQFTSSRWAISFNVILPAARALTDMPSADQWTEQSLCARHWKWF